MIQKELMLTRKHMTLKGITDFAPSADLPSEDMLMMAKGSF